eukprot:TRINITY_DN16194_c0_g1_i1.p1 TRINITY_DN16194_c0_g1~~TRINITY_DN16194_c0_g1_i1.p1  ORF type:complete len:168 (-),score=21.50 TRINITY_DN16194_c0_g1_i1:8-511(-)
MRLFYFPSATLTTQHNTHRTSFLSNMSCTITLADEVVQKFSDLESHSARYLICKINDDKTQAVLEKTGASSASWEDFTHDLPQEECRYGLFDFEFEKGGPVDRPNQILYVVWRPETAKVKARMMYGAAKEPVKSSFPSTSAHVLVVDLDKALDCQTVERCMLAPAQE